MSLVRWEPFRDLVKMQEQMDRLFRETVHSADATAEDRGTPGDWLPEVDIYEDADKILVKAELPEMDLKDIDVKIEENALRIRGERKLEHEDRRDGYRRVERSFGSFIRTFTLPQTVDADRVSAAYDRGVLRVTLPKKAEAKPKQITVQVK